MRKFFPFLFLCFSFCQVVLAQDYDPQVYAPFPTIEFNGKTETFSAPFPYGQRFYLVFKGMGTGVNKIRVAIGLNAVDGIVPLMAETEIPLHRELFKLSPNLALKPNTPYVITIKYVDPASGGAVVTIEKSVTAYSKFSDYVRVDFGLGYSGLIKGVFSVTGVQLSLAPFNRESDLGYLATRGTRGLIKQFPLRASLYLGLSPLMVSSNTESPVRNLTGAGNVVYGFGWRSPFYGYCDSGRARAFLQPMRLVAGWIVFNQNNANPLISGTKVKQTFYAGVTCDINLNTLFGPVGKIFKP